MILGVSDSNFAHLVLLKKDLENKKPLGRGRIRFLGLCFCGLCSHPVSFNLSGLVCTVTQVQSLHASAVLLLSAPHVEYEGFGSFALQGPPLIPPRLRLGCGNSAARSLSITSVAYAQTTSTHLLDTHSPQPTNTHDCSRNCLHEENSEVVPSNHHFRKKDDAHPRALADFPTYMVIS